MGWRRANTHADEGPDRPHRPGQRDDVVLRLVLLEVKAVLLVILKRLIRPWLPLCLVKQRPFVLADLQAADVRPHIACEQNV